MTPSQRGAAAAPAVALLVVALLAGGAAFVITRDDGPPPTTTTTTTTTSTTVPRAAVVDAIAAALAARLPVPLAPPQAACVADRTLDVIGRERLEVLGVSEAPLAALSEEERAQLVRAVVECLTPEQAAALLGSSSTTAPPTELPDEDL